jgi:hypothetical protein
MPWLGEEGVKKPDYEPQLTPLGLAVLAERLTRQFAATILFELCWT